MPSHLFAPALLAALLAAMVPQSAFGLPQVAGDSPPVRITTQPVELHHDFTAVRGLHALPDGRLVVTDAQERRIYLVDMDKDTRVEMGREGSGPREFRQVGLVHAAQGAGAIVTDMAQRRFLPVSPDGQLRDVVTFSTIGNESGMALSGPDMYTPDSLGPLFGNLYKLLRSPRDPQPGDSLTLLRLDHLGQRRDTIARLLQPEGRCVHPSPQVSNCRDVQFAPGDLWAVAADGWVAVIRAAPYHVEWYPPRGDPIKGANISYAAIAVTRAEKDSIVHPDPAARRAPRMAMGVGKPGPTGPPTAPLEPIFRDSKPAFSIYQLVMPGPRGRVWVERERAFRAAGGRIYDVIDRRGVLVQRVELPVKTRLAGFGARTLFLVRIDDDDLQHLQRYPMP